MMKIHRKYFVLFAFVLFIKNTIAQDITCFATGGMPFNGEYVNGQFITDKRFRKDMISQRFQSGKSIKSIRTNGQLATCNIKAVNTEDIGELGMPAPISYDNCGPSLLEWSSTIKIDNILPVKTTLHPDQEAMIRDILSEKFESVKISVFKRMEQDTSDYWQQHWKRVGKDIENAGNNYTLEAWQISGNEDRIYIVAYNNLFIYSKKDDRIIFDTLKIFLAYDSLTSTSPDPILYFRIEGDPSIYILCESFDGYEQSYRSILKAATGETVLQSISY